MNIVVPSLGRAGTSATMKWLAEVSHTIILAVQADEIDAYAKAYPKAYIITVPDDCRHHIGKVRRYILNHFKPDPIFWVDDDIRVTRKYVTTYDQMFNLLKHHLDSGVAMAGIGQQLFSNMQNVSSHNGDLAVVRNKFVSICYAIDTTLFDDCPLEELCIYDDVAIAIHAIQKSGTIVSYAATHTNVTPPTGGCNSWRTKQIIIDDLLRICKLYPSICTIRETTNTTHSQHIGIGLRVAWSQIRK